MIYFPYLVFLSTDSLFSSCSILLVRLSIELFIWPIALSFPGSLQFDFWKYYYLFNSISYISLISLFHLALWAFSLGIVCIHIFLILFEYSYHHSELLVWDFIQVVLIQIIITELVIFGEDIFPCFFLYFCYCMVTYAPEVTLLAESFFKKKFK